MKFFEVVKDIEHLKRVIFREDHSVQMLYFFPDFCFVCNTEKSVWVVLIACKWLGHLFVCSLNWA